nr:retrovirus-related Pol polyprotein from transposon TNT 1-94 [Tanacetum cinerariifolium]
VIPTTSVSRPQLKSNPMEDRVMLNNSQRKKQEVEDNHMNVKFSMNNMSLVEIILFIVDSGCSKHMTGNLKLLINFVEKFLGTEVAFRKSTCYIRDLKGNDLLTGSRGTDLYSITLQDTTSPNPICFMAKALSSQAWLWHRRLSYLKFDTINLLSKNDIVVGLPKLKFIKDHLCSSCELGKAKRKSFHAKISPSLKRRLQLLHMDLCGPMRVASINGKRYVLVSVDDYSRYTWTHFLRSKDETPEVLIDFLRVVQRGLHAQVVSKSSAGTTADAPNHPSRPNIMHATCYCARYQAKPTEKHLMAVKRIFRYLKDTIYMGLWYPKDTGFELTAFSHSDHAGYLDSRKSTYGGIKFLASDKLVSWSSKKQDCTSMSLAEADLTGRKVKVPSQMTWYEMFDSRRTGGSGK